MVKAITVSGGLIEGAAIAYQNQGWILFCKNESTIYEEHDLAYIGGICGRNFNLVYGCGNEGSVEGSCSAGGIAGINQATAASIDSCCRGLLWEVLSRRQGLLLQIMVGSTTVIMQVTFPDIMGEIPESWRELSRMLQGKI